MNLRTAQISIVSVLLLLAPVASAGAQNSSSSPIARALGEMVQGKSVATKRSFSIQSAPYARPHPRLVATDIYEDGTIKYQVYERRKGGIPVPTGEYLEAPLMEKPGWSVNVFDIQYFPDRIEFDGTNNGTFNLILGTGYQTWPVDRIIKILYSVISIPAIDYRVELENQYKSMIADLKSHVGPTPPTSPALSLDLQIENMTAKIKAYKEIADVAAQLRKMNDPIISADSTDYAALAEGVENQLVTLRTAAEAERKQKEEEKRLQTIRDLRQQAARDEASLQKMFFQMDKSEPRLEGDLAKRSQTLLSAQDVANDWQKCANLLTAAHDDATAETKKVDSANEHIMRLQAALDASRSRAQSRSIDAKYDSMVSRLTQLKSAYAASFGTAGADAAKASLRNQLGQMIANRESAAAAGSQVANQQAEQLRAELNRLH